MLLKPQQLISTRVSYITSPDGLVGLRWLQFNIFVCTWSPPADQRQGRKEENPRSPGGRVVLVDRPWYKGAWHSIAATTEGDLMRRL